MTGIVTLSDVIVPELFTPYMMTMSAEKSRLIRSGAVAMDPRISAWLNGPGLTINIPSYNDLDADDAENISSDTGSDSTASGITTLQEIQVRLSRNKSWGAADLVSSLIGNDPLNAIAGLVSTYWVRRYQRAFVAMMHGIFADNDAAPSGTDTHTQGDLTHDISRTSYIDGVTSFSAEAFLDATLTMGDSQDELSLAMMHSIVYNRALKNNLIDFVADSVNGQAISIPTFLGREVIVDDMVPHTGGVFDTWLFGAGQIRMGAGTPRVPTEVFRRPNARQGGGEEELYSRVELCFHANGHAYAGTSPAGGPSNANTTNNLGHADSWSRVFPERKQIKIARLRTREY